MKLITREEFAFLIGIKTNTFDVWRVAKKKGVPEPTEYKKQNCRPIPLWSTDVAKEFASTCVTKPNRVNKGVIKNMVSQGYTANQIAEKVDATTGYVKSLCRKMGIKARGTKSITVQPDLWPMKIKHVFNVFLHNHIQATPSIR